MKITAAILDRVGVRGPFADSRPLRLAEVDLAEPLAGELLVRIDAAGICHSDLSVVNGDRVRPTPMALGHEAAATVLRAGDLDSAFSPGDRLVLAFLPACGRCPECGSGQGFLCAPAAAANGAGLAAAYRATRRGGRTVTVGLPSPADTLSISARSLVGDGRTLTGGYMGSAIPARDVPRYVALWRAGRLPVERLLSSVGPLADVNSRLDDLASGAAVRQILLP